MIIRGNYIDGKWIQSVGEHLTSYNPSNNTLIWSAAPPNKDEIGKAIDSASNAFNDWSQLTFEDRVQYIEKFTHLLENKKKELANIISLETGKPLWESNIEVGTMVSKGSISIEAHKDRCKERLITTNYGKIYNTHQPHGVLAVFGPYNFPGHLPNGHIIPALLAGNTVVFKPSELTPYVGQEMVALWEQAGIPHGVINLLQGGKTVGSEILDHPKLNGLLFTGSWETGQIIHKKFGLQPGKILALEMGGNNPFIVGKSENLKAAAYLALISAYITSGQRCTCARRLIIPNNSKGDFFINILIQLISEIQIGKFTDIPEPFMGPLIHKNTASYLLETQQRLINYGGIPLVEMKRLHINDTFLTPCLIDMTNVSNRPDEEYFGPILQVIRTNDFYESIKVANETQYGLCATLISDDENEFNYYYKNIKTGIANWNFPTTGASSEMPFGGLGKSGNYRPSAYFAADYCTYPLATTAIEKLASPTKFFPGLQSLEMKYEKL